MSVFLSNFEYLKLVCMCAVHPFYVISGNFAADSESSC